MPRLSPEKAAEIKARIEALPISKVAFSKELGKSSNYINTVLCRGDVSPEGLALIEKKIAYLENANSPCKHQFWITKGGARWCEDCREFIGWAPGREPEEPEPAHQAEPDHQPEPAQTEETAEPAAPEPECKPKLTIGKVKFEIRELESDTSPYFLASQIEAMVKKLGPHDPDWLLLKAALIRGGVEL